MKKELYNEMCGKMQNPRINRKGKSFLRDKNNFLIKEQELDQNRASSSIADVTGQEELLKFREYGGEFKS